MSADCNHFILGVEGYDEIIDVRNIGSLASSKTNFNITSIAA